ncbi:hypothetical protein LZ554_009318 [Drepanopeziza brunnea f. sp. 'monogermtubi']|nr:hypothetical protein LZ554_009318 [Drepanopeziza brunnea f. sp. 'monogermtubi']
MNFVESSLLTLLYLTCTSPRICRYPVGSASTYTLCCCKTSYLPTGVRCRRSRNHRKKILLLRSELIPGGRFTLPSDLLKY